MLRAMFGMGGSEILVILIVALLFLGPDKLPEAAKQISKGIRDIKKQSRALQRTIEEDEHIGGAIRDLRSALRGEDEPIRPKPPRQIDAPAPAIGAVAALAAASPASEPAIAPSDSATALAAFPPETAAATSEPASAAAADAAAPTSAAVPPADVVPATSAIAEAVDTTGASFEGAPSHLPPAPPPAPKITLPPTAGESDAPAHDASAELAALVKPAPNTIARGSMTEAPETPAAPDAPERKHG